MVGFWGGGCLQVPPCSTHPCIKVSSLRVSTSGPRFLSPFSPFSLSLSLSFIKDCCLSSLSSPAPRFLSQPSEVSVSLQGIRQHPNLHSSLPGTFTSAPYGCLCQLCAICHASVTRSCHELPTVSSPPTLRHQERSSFSQLSVTFLSFLPTYPG